MRRLRSSSAKAGTVIPRQRALPWTTRKLLSTSASPMGDDGEFQQSVLLRSWRSPASVGRIDHVHRQSYSPAQTMPSRPSKEGSSAPIKARN